MITVQRIDNVTFKVTVEKDTTTTYTVRVVPSYYETLTDKCVTSEELVKRSFIFLLERGRKEGKVCPLFFLQVHKNVHLTRKFLPFTN